MRRRSGINTSAVRYCLRKRKDITLLNPIVRKFQYGQPTVTPGTGMMASQATAAVMVSMDDAAVFVTGVGQKKARPGQDFFPLTVNYQERTYAAGRIPGSFFRREGRPSEGETLIARLIDRPIRPLFPERSEEHTSELQSRFELV